MGRDARLQDARRKKKRKRGEVVRCEAGRRRPELPGQGIITKMGLLVMNEGAG